MGYWDRMGNARDPDGSIDDFEVDISLAGSLGASFVRKIHSILRGIAARSITGVSITIVYKGGASEDMLFDFAGAYTTPKNPHKRTGGYSNDWREAR